MLDFVMSTSTLLHNCLTWCRVARSGLYRSTKCGIHRRHNWRTFYPQTHARLVSHHTFPYPDIPTTEVAKSFVVQLDDRGRSLLYQELKKFEKERLASEGVKVTEKPLKWKKAKHHPPGQSAIIDGFMGAPPKVSKQQEPESLPQSTSECDAESQPAKVPRSELWNVFLFNGIPFIGFGILDNLIMIVAGEYIDATLGAALGISTMAAAGLGNLVSDVAGVGTAGYVEVLCTGIGITTPNLTPEQADMWQTRCSTVMGRIIGISLGCLIGMFPLFFFKSQEEKDAEKEEQRRQLALIAAQEAATNAASETNVPSADVKTTSTSTSKTSNVITTASQT